MVRFSFQYVRCIFRENGWLCMPTTPCSIQATFLILTVVGAVLSCFKMLRCVWYCSRVRISISCPGLSTGYSTPPMQRTTHIGSWWSKFLTMSCAITSLSLLYHTSWSRSGLSVDSEISHPFPVRWYPKASRPSWSKHLSSQGHWDHAFSIFFNAHLIELAENI